MRGPRLVDFGALVVGLALLLGSAGSQAGLQDVPQWVPQEYRSYFVHYVDDRSTLERALNQIGWTREATGRSFALVAGISRYPKMQGKAADLQPAADDVAKLVAYLKNHEFFNEIVVLENQDVTPENLRYFLTNYFPRGLQQSPKSRFLFAYSGHGMTQSNRGFILTTEATSLEDRYDAISMDVLRAMFQDVVDTGYQVLALINACYGGRFINMSFGDREYPPQREGAHAITAGRSGELTWHDPDFGAGTGSLFFEAVLAGLDGRADHLPEDGLVTIKELDAYLSDTISRFTNSQQNPQSGDLRPEQSPGGFFFLDRRRQVEARIAEPFDHATAVTFGRHLIEEARPQLSALGGIRREPEPARPVQPTVGIHQFKPGDEFSECEDCPRMVVVPAGSFTMGSPKGRYEVTFDEWDTCVDDGGCSHKPENQGWGRGNRPVINVSWNDAAEYVVWLKTKTDQPYRLPSEAEWEYAARAKTTTPFWTGATISTEQANYDGNHTYGPGRKGEYRAQTTPVDTFDSNPWGLHDMNGNVWEWVEDCWHDSYEGAPDDGRAWLQEDEGDCSRRVLRGGSWGDNPGYLRSALRDWGEPDYRGSFVGFRVARTLSRSESVTP